MRTWLVWYRAFREQYVVQQRRPQEYFINRYYAHLLDPFVTKLVHDLRMTPNGVTVLAGLMGVSSAASLAMGQPLWGALLLQLHHLFDGADGNLARLLNRCTPFGAKLDKWVDQVVRAALVVAIVLVADVPLWAKVLWVVTPYLDLAVIHCYVLPFARKRELVRSRWKTWFLQRGVIPGFDIFTVYFLISVFALMNRLDWVVYIVIAGKNLDWMYRVWEVWKTKRLLTVAHTVGSS